MKLIGRKQLLNQSHPDRAEMTCVGDWVIAGSTLTALDGRIETTVLTPNWTIFISDSGFNLCAEKHVVCQSCAVALKSID